MTDDRSPTRHLAAIVAGLFLATLPFWRYVPFGGALGAHMDHEPRHGGQLGMVGEHHVEVARRNGRVEVFVSDARRQPVRPQSGRLVFDRKDEVGLVWDNHRLIAGDQPAATEIEARVMLADASELAISFDFGQEFGELSKPQFGQ